MFLTRNLIFWALGGIPFILLFGRLLGPWGAAVAYNCVLTGLVLLDFSICPSQKQVQITRQVEDKLSLGVTNPVLIEIKNAGRLRTKILVKDHFPGALGELPPPKTVLVPPGETRQVEYQLNPTRRGEYSFGPLSVRLLGVLGLAGRQFSLTEPRPVKVYPNVRGISTYRLLTRKNHLLEAGLKPSKILGTGTDFDSLRDYVPGDEYRKINWKATARRSRLVTSQYQVEKSQNVFIAIEAGRMMAATVKGMTRFDYSVNSALLLSYVAMEKGDNVGLMVFADEIMAFLPPKRGKGQLKRIIEALYKLEPRLVEADYRQAVGYMTMKNRKRSLVVLFTDLIDEDVSRAVLTYSRGLYPVHLPLCVAMSDPALSYESTRSQGNETGFYRRAVALDLLHQREQVKSILNRGGVATLDVMPEKLTPSLITRYLTLKAKNRL